MWSNSVDHAWQFKYFILSNIGHKNVIIHQWNALIVSTSAIPVRQVTWNSINKMNLGSGKKSLFKDGWDWSSKLRTWSVYALDPRSGVASDPGANRVGWTSWTSPARPGSGRGWVRFSAVPPEEPASRAEQSSRWKMLSRWESAPNEKCCKKVISSSNNGNSLHNDKAHA